MNKLNKNSINGKKFVEALALCDTKEKVFALLDNTMDRQTLAIRLKNVNDKDLIVNLDASKARLNAMNGCRTSNQDCVNMAASKFTKLTGKSVKHFKVEANKFITQNKSKAPEVATKTPLTMNILNNNVRVNVH